MNEQVRLTVLQKLSSGEISAEQAARMLSGEEAPTMEVEVEVKPAPSATPSVVVEKVVAAEPQVEVEAHAVEVENPQVQIEIVQDKSGVEAKQLRFSAVDANGDLDIDLIIPMSLIKLGQQIGERFAPVLDGWNGTTLDLDLNLDTLHVRIAAQ